MLDGASSDEITKEWGRRFTTQAESFRDASDKRKIDSVQQILDILNIGTYNEGIYIYIA